MKLNLGKILRELRPYRERQAMVEVKHVALLVIDMQNFFHRIVQPIMANTLRVIQTSRQRNVPVIFTQHGHTDKASDRGELGEWWGEVILDGTATGRSEFHFAALKNLGFGFAYLITCDELIQMLKES